MNETHMDELELKHADQIVEASVLLYGFFKDYRKVVLWVTTPNPNLGGAIPGDLIESDRGEKLLKFIRNALDENKLEGT